MPRISTHFPPCSCPVLVGFRRFRAVPTEPWIICLSWQTCPRIFNFAFYFFLRLRTTAQLHQLLGLPPRGLQSRMILPWIRLPLLWIRIFFLGNWVWLLPLAFQFSSTWGMELETKNFQCRHILGEPNIRKGGHMTCQLICCAIRCCISSKNTHIELFASSDPHHVHMCRFVCRSYLHSISNSIFKGIWVAGGTKIFYVRGNSVLGGVKIFSTRENWVSGGSNFPLEAKPTTFLAMGVAGSWEACSGRRQFAIIRQNPQRFQIVRQNPQRFWPWG